ncbi:hypothetical protein OHB26_16295 [Nocardia sp. NBC_01503]|uniref:hypothetical protein n=1 Tax=Nocardia sp. NBC_01503 TaxID=2975997 RepID=UPI002E7C2F1D|nr:hypothetical protein [Nocardia sp. NBC_01503]WTL35611.1 hypothetical protein OHB26_16295 [Nocardia sp. NBC_01503]
MSDHSEDPAEDQSAERPGESLYNGMFALDGVSGSSFLNGMSRALGESAFQGIEKAVEILNPELFVGWETFKKVASPFQNLGSTAGKILRIKGRIPNLDPHVYGNDGPLSTTRTGTLFNFLNPLKSYVGGKVFSAVSEQVQKALAGNNNADAQNSDNPGDGSPANGQQNPPDISQLAWNALQNAGRDITKFTTPMLTVPTTALGENVQVNKAFSIVMDLAPYETLARDRRNDAILAFPYK